MSTSRDSSSTWQAPCIWVQRHHPSTVCTAIHLASQYACILTKWCVYTFTSSKEELFYSPHSLSLHLQPVEGSFCPFQHFCSYTTAFIGVYSCMLLCRLYGILLDEIERFSAGSPPFSVLTCLFWPRRYTHN